ncbi:hypothetical protein LB465_11495 [Salegentibacter sp. LM13S]|uniref:hypothetical protein n=1 Tax=Salegentibacter lacus TaxID=2873599 RepID=UPI001CCBFD32|nr:hypothetical protein [Salegentibacter lacus]MBZ9631405.1 hypothetical protein [Salegentibacter lacus]
MRKIELIFGAVAATSIAYKFVLGNAINPIFIMSITGLSLFYTYFSFAYFNHIPFKKILKKESYSGISKWRILGTVGLGFGLGIIILGVLFSLMDWPFNTYYSLGIPILGIIGIISFVKYLSGRSDVYSRILKRILVIGGVAVIFWLTPQENLNEMLGIKTNQTEKTD